MADPDIVAMARAAERDERLSDGALYGKLADEISRLREENGRLRGHLAEIDRWARAYPETVFPEPDLKRAHELLWAGGMTLDAISAHAMRHVVRGVGEIARCGLEGDR